jgi:hypothetical protein
MQKESIWKVIEKTLHCLYDQQVHGLHTCDIIRAANLQ